MVGWDIFYIGNTVISGKTKPNRVTWLMWAIAPLVAAVAAYVDGVRWAVLPVFMAGFAPFLVFLSSYVNPKSYWELGVFDYGCGGLSVLALVCAENFWYFRISIPNVSCYFKYCFNSGYLQKTIELYQQLKIKFGMMYE